MILQVRVKNETGRISFGLHLLHFLNLRTTSTPKSGATIATGRSHDVQPLPHFAPCHESVNASTSYEVESETNDDALHCHRVVSISEGHQKAVLAREKETADATLSTIGTAFTETKLFIWEKMN